MNWAYYTETDRSIIFRAVTEEGDWLLDDDGNPIAKVEHKDVAPPPLPVLSVKLRYRWAHSVIGGAVGAAAALVADRLV